MADGRHANDDGVLTPKEVWYFRTLSMRARNSEKVQAADQLMGKMYLPKSIDSGQNYGPIAGKRIKLFVLSGQSNMVGQGLSAELAEDLQIPNDRVLMFERGVWQPLRPLIPTFGPEISFGLEISRAFPDETIGIVKQSRNGTGILAWHLEWTVEKANRTGDGHKGNLWLELTEKIQAAINAAECDVAGFVWMQGAKDMLHLDLAKQYASNLKALVEGLREITEVADLPLIVGSYRSDKVPDDLSELAPDARDTGLPMNREGAFDVLQAHFEAQRDLSPAKMVPLRGLERHSENGHFNTNGQLELGLLFAKAFLELAP